MTARQADHNLLDTLVERRDSILEGNRQDMEDAALLVELGEMSAALRKRLDLSGDKFEAMLDGIRDLVQLPDPVGPF